MQREPSQNPVEFLSWGEEDQGMLTFQDNVLER